MVPEDEDTKLGGVFIFVFLTVFWILLTLFGE